jgi:hypothetical protein
MRHRRMRDRPSPLRPRRHSRTARPRFDSPPVEGPSLSGRVTRPASTRVTPGHGVRPHCWPLHGPAPLRLQRLGEGWVVGPSRRDVQRPSGDPLQTAPWPGCRAVSSPPGTARMGLRITPSQSAHGPQSPRKVRNSAIIGRRRPTMLNDERAAPVRFPSISARSRTPRVSSGSSSRRTAAPQVASGVPTFKLLTDGRSRETNVALKAALGPFRSRDPGAHDRARKRERG